MRIVINRCGRRYTDSNQVLLAFLGLTQKRIASRVLGAPLPMSQGTTSKPPSAASEFISAAAYSPQKIRSTVKEHYDFWPCAIGRVVARLLGFLETKLVPRRDHGRADSFWTPL